MIEDVAPALQVMVLRCQMQSLDLSLSTGMGALWRSALGRAIHATSATAFSDLYGEGQQGRLFALCPPLRPVRPAETFEWGVTLFGPHVAHAEAVVQAIQRMGLDGVGHHRQRALLLSVHDGAGPCWQFDRGWLRSPKTVDGGRWWLHPPVYSIDARGPQLLRIDCLTPVAFKRDNDWSADIPALEQWVRRALGRTAQLSQAARQSNPIGRSRADQFIEWSRLAQSGQAVRHTKMMLRRRSSRTGHSMQLPTLLGAFDYCVPHAHRLWPLLKWMELVQVGAKTAFGCGVVRAELTVERV